jgi:hypothetical protein
MENINEKDIIAFNPSDVIVALKGKFDSINCIDNKWLHYECDVFAISFNLATEQQIMLHIHILDESEAAVESVVCELCRLFKCRAFDTSSGGFLAT